MTWLRRLFGRKRPRTNAMLASLDQYVIDTPSLQRWEDFHGSNQHGR